MSTDSFRSELEQMRDRAQAKLDEVKRALATLYPVTHSAPAPKAHW